MLGRDELGGCGDDRGLGRRFLSPFSSYPCWLFIPAKISQARGTRGSVESKSSAALKLFHRVRQAQVLRMLVPLLLLLIFPYRDGPRLPQTLRLPISS